MKFENQRVCDICGKARNGHVNHDACSKIRQNKGFATKRKGEAERISDGKRVARKYLEGRAYCPE